MFAQSILYICIHCSEIPCEYNITAIYEKDITFKEENKEISLFVPNGESNIEVKINNEMQSKYIIYVLSSNMMEIKNDFVSNDKVKFDKVYSKAKTLCSNIQFNWVKGHDINEFNNVADKLAVEASNFI